MLGKQKDGGVSQGHGGEGEPEGDANIEMTEILELFEKYFKSANIKRLY